MEAIINMILYYFLYSTIYSLPLIIIILALNYIGINMANIPNEYDFIRLILLGIVLVFSMVLPVYHAKIASENKTGDIGFWEAHRISVPILKSNLSFLPIIGKIFEQK